MIRRRTLLATPLAFLFPVPVFAADDGGPKPLIVMLEADPWLMVIGSDSPRFALYDDGTVIYREAKGFKTVRLTADARTALIDRVKPEALAAAAGFHDLASGVSDQPTTYFFIYGSGKPRMVGVYGQLRDAHPRTSLPPAIKATYDVLSGYRHDGATDWLPDMIEVMIWPYEYAPEASIIWPKGWPGLDDPKTVKRREGAYSLHLPATQYPALVAFLRTRNQKGAVEIDGRKWAASYRFPFPRERSWLALRSEELSR